MTGEQVCLTVAAEFKKRKLSYFQVADQLGQSVQTVYNRISSKKYFSEGIAQKWSDVFGFNKVFLMTGEGSIDASQPFSPTSKLDDMTVLLVALDYLLVYAGNQDVRKMWNLLVQGKTEEYRKLEAKVTEDASIPHMRMPKSVLDRLQFLKAYDDFSIDL